MSQGATEGAVGGSGRDPNCGNSLLQLQLQIAYLLLSLLLLLL